MSRFVEGEDRRQAWLLPESLNDYVGADNPVRIVEVFIDELDLGALGFAGVEPAATGRPAYHPLTLLRSNGGVDLAPEIAGGKGLDESGPLAGRELPTPPN